jgi:hypothetical protein
VSQQERHLRAVPSSPGTRIQNVSGSEHCTYCCESPGLIMVAWVHTRKDIPHEGSPADCRGCSEQTGPCPFCEKGRALEFPENGRKPWGPQGFWRGIQPQHQAFTPTCSCNEPPLPRAEALKRLRELMTRVEASISADRIEKKPVAADDTEAAEARRRRDEAEAKLREAMKPPAVTLLDETPRPPTTLL